MFTNANGIVPGGVVGVSTVLNKQFGWDPAIVQAAINLPTLALGFLFLTRRDAMKSVLGSIAMPLAIFATKDVKLITHDPMMAALFGGAMYGVGLGIILRSGGTVGGFSLLATVFHKFLSFPIPAIVFLFDAITIVCGVPIFGADKALLGLLGSFVMRQCITWVLTGFRRSAIAYIITDKRDEMREKILVDLDRGLTILSAEGGYTGKPQNVLMVVASQVEIPYLRMLVREVDPSAFVILTDATEVLGQGFSGSV